MSPGFIGVGAGAWSDPLPAPTPFGGVELYYFPYPDPQMYLGKEDGIVVPVGDPLPGTAGVPLEVASYAARENVVVLATSDEAPPYGYRYSTDAGATWTEVPYEATPITGFPGQDASSPAAMAAPLDWWENVGVGGEGAGLGGLFRDTGGPSGPAYTKWGDGVLLSAQFSLGPTYCYGIGLDDGWQIIAWDAATAAATTILNDTSGDGGVMRGQAGDCCLIGRIVAGGSFGTTPMLIRRIVGLTVSTPTGLPSDAVDLGNIDANGSVLMASTVAAGGAAAIWKSTDQGASWTSVKTWTIPSGLGVENIAPPLTAVPSTAGVWWAGWAHDPGIEGDEEHPPVSGWWRTADDGATWALVEAPAPHRFYYHGAGHPIIDIAGGPGSNPTPP